MEYVKNLMMNMQNKLMYSCSVAFCIVTRFLFQNN